MELISDILLIGAALAATGYCIVLSRRLRKFTDLEQGVGGAIAVLSVQVDDMTKTLKSAQSSAAESARSLGDLTARAEGAAQRLELLVASLHDLPDPAAAHDPSAPERAEPESPPASARQAPSPQPAAEPQAVDEAPAEASAGAPGVEPPAAPQAAPEQQGQPLQAEETPAGPLADSKEEPASAEAAAEPDNGGSVLFLSTRRRARQAAE